MRSGEVEMMGLLRGVLGLSLLALLLGGRAEGASATYFLTMTSNPDGVATGTLLIDDVTGLVSWDFVHPDFPAPSAMHIHGPGGSVGNSAFPLVYMDVSTTGGPGTLINSQIYAPLSDLTALLGDPTDYYVNMHNDGAYSGEPRGQLGVLVPEPTSALLMVLGVPLAWLVGRRRR